MVNVYYQLAKTACGVSSIFQFYILMMEKIKSGYCLKIEPVTNENNVRIEFSLPQKSHVILKILTSDLFEVRLLLNELLLCGSQAVLMNCGNLVKGDYIIRLIINNTDSIDIENLNFKIE